MTDTDRAPELELDPTQLEAQAPQQDAQPPVSETEPAPEPAYIEIDGQRYDATTVEPYVRTMRWATENPERWQQIQQWEQRGYVNPELQPPQTQQPPPADELDDEDEYIPARVRRELDEMREWRADMEEQRAAEDRAAIDLGLEQFLSDYNDLTEEDRNQVLIAARDWQLVAAAVERSTPGRTVQAVKDAFEHAYRMTFFDRAGQQAANTAVTNISRARRAATAQSQRPTPRVQAPPKIETARDLENALKEQIAEAFEANR